MRSFSITAAAIFVLMTTACGGSNLAGPTGEDIAKSMEADLKSVAGDWIGVNAGPNTIRLDFKLQEASNGQVTGTGTMKEENAPAAVPITITGTFVRPNLTLVFNGMVYETHQVQGAAQGAYISVGGVATKLTLTGTGYSREVNILLQEKIN